MKKSMHTPGPWKISKILDNGGVIDIQPIDVQICDGMDGPQVNLANAYLIAAAPELLSALELLFGAISTSELERLEIVTKKPIFVICRDALANAKGTL